MEVLLTLKHGASIKGPASAYYQYDTGSALVVEGGTLSGSSSSYPAVRIDTGTARIIGGTITNTAGGYGLFKSSSATCYIEGGSISSKNF